MERLRRAKRGQRRKERRLGGKGSQSKAKEGRKVEEGGGFIEKGKPATARTLASVT